MTTTTTAPGSFFSSSDENVGPASSAFYLGIFYTMAIGKLSKTTKNVLKNTYDYTIYKPNWQQILEVIFYENFQKYDKSTDDNYFQWGLPSATQQDGIS